MGGAEISGWILWMLPVLFLIHDTEEALFLPAWVRRNRTILAERLPRPIAKLLPHFERITPRLFATMAAEELLLLVGATLYASLSGETLPWLALFLAFTLHLPVHVGQGMVLRRYLPCVGTALCCLPVCVYAFYLISGDFSAVEIAICAVAGIATAATNLWLIHYLANRFAPR